MLLNPVLLVLPMKYRLIEGLYNTTNTIVPQQTLKQTLREQIQGSEIISLRTEISKISTFQIGKYMDVDDFSILFCIVYVVAGKHKGYSSFYKTPQMYQKKKILTAQKAHNKPQKFQQKCNNVCIMSDSSVRKPIHIKLIANMCISSVFAQQAWLLRKRQLRFKYWIMLYKLTTLLKDCLLIAYFSVDNDKCG